MERRVFVSMTFDDYLSDEQNEIKWAIIERILQAELRPHFFFAFVPTEYKARVIAESPWGADKVEAAMRECVGAVMLGYPRWTWGDGEHLEKLASEYTHYEAGVARTLGLPMFMLLEEGTRWRGAFDGHANHICVVPERTKKDWLNGPTFAQPFNDWLERVGDRKDIFLGYSSEAEGPAGNIKGKLREFGATVLDWAEFEPGTILEQIETAAARCSAGVFLFTKSDKLEGDKDKAAPRDNVVFEAGYFAHAKGHKRVLIVLEEGAKMPADLGGAIYAPLEDRSNVEKIKDQLERFVHQLHR